MDFSLSEEQLLLQESIEKFVQNEYGFEQRQKMVNSELGFSPDYWRLFAELGWTAIPFSEEDGGYGGTPVELMVIMEQFGRGLVVEPYLATLVLAGGLLARAATPAQRQTYLPDIIGGSSQAAFAFAEAQGGFDLSDVTTTATREGDSYVLNGHKVVVFNGPTADLLVLSARTSGAQTDDHGVSLFLVEAGSKGIERRSYPTVDDQRAADIQFSDLRVGGNCLLGEAGTALPAIRATVDIASLAVCAEAVGIMEMLYKKTVEYTKSRVQFGVPISSFQALQHRMVDMFMSYEQSKSLLYMATMEMGNQGKDAAKAVSALKYYIGTAGRKLGQEAVQLHGGMGVTDELDIAHYFKRLTMIDTLFGNADFHFKRFVDPRK